MHSRKQISETSSPNFRQSRLTIETEMRMLPCKRLGQMVSTNEKRIFVEGVLSSTQFTHALKASLSEARAFKFRLKTVLSFQKLSPDLPSKCFRWRHATSKDVKLNHVSPGLRLPHTSRRMTNHFRDSRCTATWSATLP